MRSVIVIPARLAAQRLPNKPLAALGGVPLVVRVARQAAKARADRVIVAADDQTIVDAAKEHGFEARLTSTAHPSGTDRVAAVAQEIDAEVVLNLQGDEPFVDPRDLDLLLECMRDDPAIDMATLKAPLGDLGELDDPNVVKVVTDDRDRALYFSRAAIPYARHGARLEGVFVHLGVYAYRRTVLARLAELPVHPLEAKEGLEQLRALAHGVSIAVCTAYGTRFGIDTPDDLERARERVARLGEAAFVG